MNAITTAVQMPLAASQHIREIERLGFKYRFHPQFDISLLDLKGKRVQVREADNYSPPENVRSYAEALRGGAEFPPIVITADNYVVDANTRVEAARKIKLPNFPALVLTVGFEKADDDTKSKLFALAATLNQLGGQRLKTAEAQSAVVHLAHLGWTTPNIQRAVNLSPGQINRVKRIVEAKNRMMRLGMTPPTDDYCDKAGDAKALLLNDEPFKRFVHLLVDAGLKAAEAKNLADEMRKAGSDQGAIDFVSARRNDMEDRIRDKALTGNGKPPKSARFRMFLGSILGYEGKEEDAIEYNSTLRADHIDRIERGIRVLETALALQKERLDV